MELLLGATMDPEGRSQHDHAAPPGRTGAFPLHAVPRGETTAVCGAPVRELLEERWPASQETRCEACERVLADEAPKEQGAHRPIHPHGMS